MLKFAYIITFIGILLGLVSAILIGVSTSLSNVLSYISTLISIILGFVSIVYTYKSGKETLENLNIMKQQNRKLVEQITKDATKDVFDGDNIKDMYNLNI